MAVSDGFRRRGVASGLLKAVDEHAKVGFMTHPIQPAHSSFVGPCVMNECQWLKPWIWLHGVGPEHGVVGRLCLYTGHGHPVHLPVRGDEEQVGHRPLPQGASLPGQGDVAGSANGTTYAVQQALSHTTARTPPLLFSHPLLPDDLRCSSLSCAPCLSWCGSGWLPPGALLGSGRGLRLGHRPLQWPTRQVSKAANDPNHSIMYSMCV